MTKEIREEIPPYLLEIEKYLVKDPRKAELELIDILRTTENEYIRHYLAKLLGYSCIYQSNFSEARKYFFQLYDYSLKQGFLEFEGVSLHGIAIIEAELGDLQKSEIHAKRAMEIFQNLDNSEMAAKTGMILGGIYYQQKKPTQAIKYLSQIETAKIPENFQLKIQLLSNKALILREMGEVSPALQNFEEALSLAEKNDLYQWQCAILYNTAETREIMGDYDTALDIFQRGIELAKKINDQRSLALLDVGQANILLQLGRFIKANHLLEEAVDLYQNLEDPVRYAQALQLSAKFWELKTQYLKARDLLSKSVTIIEDTESFAQYAEILVSKARIEDQLGETKKAYSDIKLANKLAKKYDINHVQIEILQFRANKAMEIKNFFEAEFLFIEALQIAKKMNNFLYLNICNLLFLRYLLLKYLDGELDQPEEKTQIILQIQEKATESLKLAETNNQHIFKILLYEILGITYVLLEQPQGEIVKLDKALEISKKLAFEYHNRLIQEIQNSINMNRSTSEFSANLKDYLVNRIINILRDPIYSFRECTVTANDINNLAIIVFKIDERLGPMIQEKANIDLSDPTTRTNVLKTGSLYSIILGQGQLYHEDLFGPLLFTDPKTFALIYTQTIKDETQKEKRTKGQAYFLFTLIFPDNLNVFFYDRTKLSEIFAKEIAHISEAKEISSKFLEKIIQSIKKGFFVGNN